MPSRHAATSRRTLFAKSRAHLAAIRESHFSRDAAAEGRAAHAVYATVSRGPLTRPISELQVLADTFTFPTVSRISFGVGGAHSAAATGSASARRSTGAATASAGHAARTARATSRPSSPSRGGCTTATTAGIRCSTGRPTLTGSTTLTATRSTARSALSSRSARADARIGQAGESGIASAAVTAATLGAGIALTSIVTLATVAARAGDRAQDGSKKSDSRSHGVKASHAFRGDAKLFTE
jgi:hypothetical protein